MVECNSIEAPSKYPNLNDQQQFRLNKINEAKDYFIDEIKERELMSKRFSKYIDFFFISLLKSLIALSATSGSVSVASFATVIGAPVGIASACFSLAFSASTEIVKKLLKATRNKKKKHSETVILATSKLNSIESKISKALINNEISHEDFNEERNYQKLKESIGMIKSQRSDTEKINLIEEGKKIGIDEVIKRNEIINNSLQSLI